MSHHHDHDHDHSHKHGKNVSYHVLMISIFFILSFAIIETIGGYWAGSLALLGDAGHMASDALALGIAAFAAWISAKPASSKHSYGFGRAEVIAAWASSLFLVAISVAIIVEAVDRLHSAHYVKGGMVVLIASIGLLINLVVAWLLARTEKSLNIRAALLHVMGDVLGSIAAIISGAVIYYTGFLPIDPILSIFIGILILISSIRLLRESLLVLMEGVPSHINLTEVSKTLSQIDGVIDIHDLHIWTLSSGKVALSAHIQVHDFSIWDNVLKNLIHTIETKFSINHITLQPEPEITACSPC